MKTRGLDGSWTVFNGLEKVFKEEFPNGKIQRCEVHVSRKDDLRSIFYASSKKRADELALWKKEIPFP